MSDKKGLLIKYGCCAASVALFGLMYLNGKDIFSLDLHNQLRYWADVFTVPGLLMILIGALIWSSTQGAMDGIGYAAGMLGRSLIPGGRGRKDETYGEYLERKQNSRAKGYGFLFLAGGVTLAIGLILTALFYFLP